MSSTISKAHISRALKFAKNNTATGMNNCPYELWKALNQYHIKKTKLNQSSFNISKILTKVFQDIQMHKVNKKTNFTLS